MMAMTHSRCLCDVSQESGQRHFGKREREREKKKSCIASTGRNFCSWNNQLSDVNVDVCMELFEPAVVSGV